MPKEPNELTSDQLKEYIQLYKELRGEAIKFDTAQKQANLERLESLRRQKKEIAELSSAFSRYSDIMSRVGGTQTASVDVIAGKYASLKETLTAITRSASFAQDKTLKDSIAQTRSIQTQIEQRKKLLEEQKKSASSAKLDLLNKELEALELMSEKTKEQTVEFEKQQKLKRNFQKDTGGNFLAALFGGEKALREKEKAAKKGEPAPNPFAKLPSNIANSIVSSLAKQSGGLGAVGSLVQGGLLYRNLKKEQRKQEEEQTKANDLVGYGKRVLLAPEGTFAFNDKDDILAGTKLFKANDAAIPGSAGAAVAAGASGGGAGDLLSLDATDKALLAAGQPELVAAKKLGEAAVKFKDALNASFTQIDKDASDLAQSLNTNYDTALDIRAQFIDIAAKSDNIFVNAKEITKAQIALNNQLGVAVRLTDEQLVQQTKLRAGTKLGEEVAGDTFRQSLLEKKSQDDILKSRLAQVRLQKALTNSAVDERKVLKDLATLNDSVRISYLGQDEALSRAVVTARTLGMEMKNIEGIQRNLLNFESSIQSQMEAELMTGKAMNLERARYAALTNDIGTLVTELNKQGMDGVSYSKLNFLAQESYAKSLGMSREELSKTLIQQQVLSALKTNDLEAVKKEYELSVRNGTQKQFLAKLGDKALQDQFEQMSIQDRMTAATERMGLAMEAIAESLAGPAWKAKLAMLEGTATVTDFMAEGAPNSTNKGRPESYVGGEGMTSQTAVASKPKNTIITGMNTYTPSMDDGGVVQETGMIRAHKGEVYAGTNTIELFKGMANDMKAHNEKLAEQNNILRGILAKNTSLYVDRRELATATADGAATSYGSLFNPNTTVR